MSQNFFKTWYRILCVLMVCFFVVPVTLVYADTETEHAGYTEIYDAQGLMAIANDPKGKYILMADISLSGIDWYPVNFYGSIDGNGYTIYDLKSTQMNTESNTSVDGNAKKYETYFSGLFGQTEHAVIKNVKIKACDIRINTDKNCFIGGIAGYTANTEISDCSVQGVVYLYSKNTMCGVAGITGFGYGTITGCQTDVTLVIVDQNDPNKKCEQFLGGILASGYSDIKNCTINLAGYVSIHGYAHNGGIVGMDYIHTADKEHAGYVSNNSVNGVISFFENNRDRRAYCAAYIGEIMNYHVSNSGNTTISFKRDERFEYNKILLPDACDNPVYTKTITKPTCTEMGHTTYTCQACGYSYIADYTFAGHEADEMKTVLKPTYTEEGLECSYCKVCGKPVREVAIPKLLYMDNCILEKPELKLSYKSEYTLAAEADEKDSANWNVIWSSSDQSVVAVDESGKLTATGHGTAVITCSLSDGTPLGTSTVKVHNTFLQWLIIIFLFGWIWY